MAKLTTAELKRLIKKNPIARDIPEGAMDIVIYKAVELNNNNNFDPIAIDLLVMYALNMDQLKSIDKELAETGQTVTRVDRYGNSHLDPHPLCKIRNDVVAEIRRIGKLFGFSPLDSQHIPTRGKTPSELFDEMFPPD